jgi:ATP-dependent RNA helicase RhlB
MIKRLLRLFRRKSSGTTTKTPTLPTEDTVTPQAPAEHAHQKTNKPKRFKKPHPAPKAAVQQRPRTPVKKDWSLKEFEVIPKEGASRFHDFNLPDKIMHAIADLDFKYCTPIQAQTLALTMSGTDAIGQAQTGTGKTAAFLIAIINSLLADRQEKRPKGCPRSLIIAPTRELVMQIAKDSKDLTKYCSLNVCAVFGGMDYEKQQRAIEQRPVDIMVATPGRLIDFQRRRIVDLKKVKIMVVDEADRMLDMGFIPDVRRIVNSTPPKENRQTLMFSATMTQDVKRLASQWCKKPTYVKVEAENVTVDTVDQIVYLATAEEKYAILYNLIKGQDLKKVLVFTNRKDETRTLCQRLQRNNINCDMLSGDVAQKKRMTILEKFRDGHIKVLVATDVAGRGIHIDGISHVFNYVLPYEAEDYVHRIGRTGRAGHEGIAISFADEEAAFYLPEIEKYIERKLECVYPDDELVKPAPKGSTPKHATGKKPYKKYSGKRRSPGGYQKSSNSHYSPRKNSVPSKSKSHD